MDSKNLNIFKSLSSVSIILLIQRILGFGRELTLASKVGINEISDLAIILFNLPDILINIILGGGLSITIVPIFQRLNNKNKKILATQLLITIGTFFSLITILLAANNNILLKILAPGIERISYSNLLKPMSTTLIALPLTGLAAVTTSILNSNYKFKTAASGYIILNLFIIAFLFSNIPVLSAVSYGVCLGAFVRLIWQLFNIDFSINLKKIFSIRLLDFKILKKLIGNFGFVTAIVSLPVICRSYSSFFDIGAISLFNYSFKLIQLPMGIIIGSISTVFLSFISKNPTNKNIIKTIRLTFFISLILTTFFVFLSDFFVNIVYFKASFNKEQFSIIHELTLYGFIFFLPFSLVHLFGSIFAAMQRVKIQIFIGLFLIFYILLLTPIYIKLFNLNGIMISYGSSFIFALIIQILYLRMLKGKLFIKRLFSINKLYL